MFKSFSQSIKSFVNLKKRAKIYNIQKEDSNSVKSDQQELHEDYDDQTVYDQYFDDNSFRLQCEKENSFRRLHSNIHWKPLISELTYPEPIGQEQLNAYCNDYKKRKIEGIFVYNPQEGTILNAGSHELQVTFIPTKSHIYQSATGFANILIKKRKPKLKWDKSITMVYGTPISIDHLSGPLCELKGGEFIYSHPLGMKLEVGKHRFIVEYEPSPDEKINYTRAFASIEVKVIGTEVKCLEWNFPQETQLVERRLSTSELSDPNRVRKKRELNRSEELTYPHPLPEWLFHASCTDESIDGYFEYIPAKGQILNAGFNILNAVFHPSNTRKYRISTIQRTIFIRKCSYELIWPRPLGIREGDPLNESILNCRNSLNLSGKYIYSPDYGDYLKEGQHILHVKFIPDDLVNYSPNFHQIEYSVLPKKKVIIYWPPPLPIIHPEPLTRIQLNASLKGFFTKGKWEYEPNLGTVLDAGKHTLKVTFIPDRKTVEISSEIVEIIIEKGISRIVWNQPDSIKEGDQIFDHILNCFCTNLKGGTFIYDPPPGSVLEAGTHILNCKYIPENTNNYYDAEVSTKLIVRERPKGHPLLKWDFKEGHVLEYGQKLDFKMLCAECRTHRGDFDYDPPVRTKLPVGEHIVVAKFCPLESNRCLPASIKKTFRVIKSTPEIIWEPKEINLAYGTPLSSELHLNARPKDLSIEGSFVYSIKEGQILECGDYSIICEFIPNDQNNLNNNSIMVSFYVSRSRPELIWEPLDKVIKYPTYLTRKNHMNVRCKNLSITGQFKFQPDVGEVLPVGEYELWCKFIPDDLINFFSSECRTQLKVIKGTPNITWNPEEFLLYEAALNKYQHCNAKSDMPHGKFFYDPPVGFVPPADDSLKIEMKFIPYDLVNYNIVEMESFLAIGQRSPAIDWVPQRNRIKFGQHLTKKDLCAQLSLTGNSDKSLEALKDGVFEYDPPLGTILPAADIHVLQVTFVPPKGQLRNYKVVKKTSNIQVLKSVPKIIWNPINMSIIDGTPLDSKLHLNGYVDRPDLFSGSIEYFPPAGTIMPIGRQKVELKFLPEDTSNCLPYSITMFFEVTKRPPLIVWEKDPMTGNLKCIKKPIS